MRRRRSWIGGALAWLLAWPVPAGAQVIAQTVFYVDTHQPAPALCAYDLSSGALSTRALPAHSLPEGLAWDEANGKLYWVEAAYSGARIRVTDAGLGAGTTVMSGLGSLRGIAVDGAGGWMYWTSSDQGTATINRAHLDGTGHEVLLSLPGFNPRQCALDLVAGKLYWSDFEFDAWIRCNLDGSVGEYLPLPPGSRPYGIAVNRATNTLWWSHYAHGELLSMPIPASPADAPAAAVASAESDVESRSAVLLAAMRERRALPAASQVTVGGLPYVTHVWADEMTGSVYFTQAGNPSGAVRRVDVDGNGLTTLSVPEQAFGGIVVGQLSLLGAPGEGGQAPAREAWALRSPNPARAGASIEFSLPADGDVRLDVIDAAGRRVATLADGSHGAGVHRVTWTGQTGAGRAAPGVYMLRLESGGRRLTQRMTYIQ